MDPRTRARTVFSALVGSLFGALSAGCAHDWARFDPREGVDAGGAEAGEDAPVTPPDSPTVDVLPVDVVCTAPLTLCAGQCVDLTANPDNCSACGFICRPPNRRCVTGTCMR